MSTNSTIAIENSDVTVTSIYCHWDCYINGIGKTLIEHYNTREKVEQLIAGGGISTLGSYVSDKKESFNPSSNEDYTVYYTYRNEPLRQKGYSSLKLYEEDIPNQEFDYIFTKDNVWSVFFNDEWHDLEYEVEKRK